MTESKTDNRTPDDGSLHRDLQLVDRVLAGEPRAFEEIVRAYESRVYRTALAITKNQEDAEDALQETFIKAFQHLGEFRRESSLATWLTRIAINQSLQKLRARKISISLDEKEEQGGLVLPTRVEDWYSNPEVRFARQELKQIVQDAIQSLPEVYRVTFLLRDVEGYRALEAADILGISVPALKSRLLRARLLMRESLSARLARPATIKSQMMHWMLVVRDAVSARRKKPSQGRSRAER